MILGLDGRGAAWNVEAVDFPALGSWRDKARHLVRYAILAPSSHNAQPWKFRLQPDGLAVFLDRSKHLAVVDPDHREATIGVGASLMNLRVAASHFGCAYTVRYRPDPGDADLLARFLFVENGYSDPDLAALFPALLRRRTNRAAYEPRPLDGAVLDALHRASAGCLAAIRTITGREQRLRIAEMVAQADRLQFADDAFRAELSAWMRSSWSREADGMPADAFGVPDLVSPASPWVLRRFDLGGAQGRSHYRLAAESPALAVVCAEDTAAGWLEAGEMMQRYILSATAAGVQYAFLNPPIEVHALRLELRELLATTLWPQILLRLGYAKPLRRPTPRRDLSSVLVE